MPYTKAVDWWSLGILIFELLYGKPPFFQQNPKATFKHILTEPPTFTHDNHVSVDCKDFILKCLHKNPELRIGFKSDDELLAHRWFDSIDAKKLMNMELLAPIIPEINSETDVDNFNAKYTNERPKMTLMNDDMLTELKKYDPMFTGFYYDEISGSNVYYDNNSEESYGDQQQEEDKYTEEVNLDPDQAFKKK